MLQAKQSMGQSTKSILHFRNKPVTQQQGAERELAPKDHVLWSHFSYNAAQFSRCILHLPKAAAKDRHGPHFTNGKTEARHSNATCPGLPSRPVAEPRLEMRTPKPVSRGEPQSSPSLLLGPGSRLKELILPTVFLGPFL